MDSWLQRPFLSDAAAIGAALRAEVPWQCVRHWGSDAERRVCLMASEEGIRVGSACALAVPYFRFLADDIPATRAFTPVVERLRAVAQAASGQRLNHCLIQEYSPEDWIQEHGDKTLDMELGTGVVNLSFGTERDFVLRRKVPACASGEVERLRTGVSSDDGGDEMLFPLCDNSIYFLGPETNRVMTHQIRRLDAASIASKRTDAFAGRRISLTFRHIATYQVASGRLFGRGTGQGCTVSTESSETAAGGDAVFMESTSQAVRAEQARQLIARFARENVDAEFEWHAAYGDGFDCTNEDLRDALAAS